MITIAIGWFKPLFFSDYKNVYLINSNENRNLMSCILPIAANYHQTLLKLKTLKVIMVYAITVNVFIQ